MQCMPLFLINNDIKLYIYSIDDTSQQIIHLLGNQLVSLLNATSFKPYTKLLDFCKETSAIMEAFTIDYRKHPKYVDDDSCKQSIRKYCKFEGSLIFYLNIFTVNIFEIYANRFIFTDINATLIMT